MSNRNYTTISPSAKALLYAKGHTTIPYARRTAELIAYPETFVPDFDRKDLPFWARVLHFENRYTSVSSLLDDLNIKNILELSSGYSFRGLDKATKTDCYYIDTDLPEIIAEKTKIVNKLTDGKTKGTLKLVPLNALDENQFHNVISNFPEGEIAIVNEGLLMYLDAPEKEKLCSIIYNTLKERGGYWITADVYIKYELPKPDLAMEQLSRDFFAQHNIENNKFKNFDDAKTFFKKTGFAIDKEANVDYSTLSSMKYFKRSFKLKHFFKMFRAGKKQKTWRLRIAGR